MAIYSIGQRVKKIGGPGRIPSLGAEGVIEAGPILLRPFGTDTQYVGYIVSFHGHSSPWPDGTWSQRPEWLAPLTPPASDVAADAFINRIRKLAREPQPYVKERA